MNAEDMPDVDSLVGDLAVSPMVLVLVAYTATDERTLRHTSLGVDGGGGVSVNMHGHDWPAVAAMVDRLRLPRRPAKVAHIWRDRWATTFAWVGEDGRPDRSLRVVWFREFD